MAGTFVPDFNVVKDVKAGSLFATDDTLILDRQILGKSLSAEPHFK